MLKGQCYKADDIPSEHAPHHYIVIASDALPEGFVCVVAISSIKYNEHGREKFFDKSCVLSLDDIKTEDGKNLLTKPSFIRYQYAVELREQDIIQKTLTKRYKFVCRISDELLKRICDGAKISCEITPRLRKKYFS